METATRRAAIEYGTEIKKSFLETKVLPMLKAMEHELESLDYIATMSSNNEYLISETVILKFRNGGTKKVNVTADSLKATLIDTLKAF